MALAVASTSTATSTTSPVTITKPTGVAIGDLLIISGNNIGNTGISCTGFTSGATSWFDGPGAVPDAGNALLYLSLIHI